METRANANNKIQPKPQNQIKSTKCIIKRKMKAFKDFKLIIDQNVNLITKLSTF